MISSSGTEPELRQAKHGTDCTLVIFSFLPPKKKVKENKKKSPKGLSLAYSPATSPAYSGGMPKGAMRKDATVQGSAQTAPRRAGHALPSSFDICKLQDNITENRLVPGTFSGVI